MPIYQVQFQKGLSLDDFIVKYGKESSCKKALFDPKWQGVINVLIAGVANTVNSLEEIISATNVTTKPA